MTVYESKPIRKTDDASKQFIIECLQGDETHGFDVDSIYFCKGQWVLFEYLKCENKHMTPHTSDPKYYPWNWKKFYNLYILAQQLGGTLFLVNYSDREQDRDLVKVMEVRGFDCDMINKYESLPYEKRPPCLEYLQLISSKTTRKEFSKWLREEINAKAELPTFLRG